MIINTMLIEQFAAEAFWFFVYKYDMQSTGFPDSIDDIPDLMWSREIARKKLIQLGEADEEKLVERLYMLVANVIATHGTEEKNIIGTIYVEDFKECKEKDFPYTHLITQLVNDSDENYDLKIKGQIPHVGTLLLRTPFPSGVLLKEIPVKSNLLIPNTNNALGFKKTMVLMPKSISILPDNAYGYRAFISGIFCISTTKPADTIWHKIIPNSICSLETQKFYNISK
jgi:hypothetical protein